MIMDDHRSKGPYVTAVMIKFGLPPALIYIALGIPITYVLFSKILILPILVLPVMWLVTVLVLAVKQARKIL